MMIRKDNNQDRVITKKGIKIIMIIIIKITNTPLGFSK